LCLQTNPNPRNAGDHPHLHHDRGHDRRQARTAPLEALWWEAKGDWSKAREIAQAQEDASSSWVHAYLHRVEGDLSNDGYWYRRAGRTPAKGALETERKNPIGHLLASAPS